MARGGEMGRAGAAKRLRAVTRLIRRSSDLPLTPERGRQRLPVARTREVSWRLPLTVEAAGPAVHGPRFLLFLTPLQPLK